MIELKPISKSISEDEILKCVSYTSNDFVFVSGSLIEGLGNKKSDLDIFVITEEFERLDGDPSIVYDRKSVKITFTCLNGIGCDIEYWPISTLDTLIEQLNSIDFTDESKRSLNQLSIEGSNFEDLTSLLHRFIVSKPVYNHDLYNRKKNKINLNNYFKLMTRVVVNLIDNSYEDIIGNFQKGELETALIIAKDTLIKAITAYVYSNHKSIDRGKWAYIKLKSLSFENDEALEILNKFNQLYFFSNMNDISEIEKLIEEYIYFINRIIELAGKKLGGY